MPRALLANNISTTLSAAITSTAATTFTVTSATGMPAPTGGAYFYCTLLDSAAVPEIVKVTNVTGTTLTCVRAQDGTAARTFLVGATVKINLTAAVIAELTATGDTVSFAGVSVTGTVTGSNLSGTNTGDTAPNNYSLADTGGAAGYIFLGTWNSAPQNGCKLTIIANVGTGYNATTSQDALYFLNFKTSNSSSSQTGSSGVYYADGLAYRFGPANAISAFRVIQNSSASYAVYANCSTFSGVSTYSVQLGSGTWTHNGTVSTPSGNYIDITPALLYESSNFISGTNYAPATSGSSILYGNGAGGFSNVTLSASLSFSGGTLSVISGGGMVYPGAGIPNSTGSSWGTSYSTTGSGTVVALSTSPTFVTPILGTPTSGNLANCAFPTLNQNTTGTAANVTGTVAVGNGGTGATTFTSGGLLVGNGTGVVSAITPGTNGNVLTSNGTTWSSQPPITAGTAVATTSGTAIDFTGIPSWVKRVTVMLNGVSTNGTSTVVIRIGSSGGVEATGYTGSSGLVYGVNSTAAVSSTTDFLIDLGGATVSRNGALTLTNLSGLVWVISGCVTDAAGGFGVFNSGSKTLAGALDRVRLTTTNGTDTFDAGSVNITYE